MVCVMQYKRGGGDYMLEWHGPAGTYTARNCSCSWETGLWTVCDAHRKPHSEHTAEDRAPWCPECQVEFLDDDEMEDVCRGCGKSHVSHARTESDEYCPECRFGRGE